MSSLEFTIRTEPKLQEILSAASGSEYFKIIDYAESDAEVE
jgi:hypothetical protein